MQVAGRYTALHDALYTRAAMCAIRPALASNLLIHDGGAENSALNLDDGLRVATRAHPVFAIGVGRATAGACPATHRESPGGEYVPSTAPRADLAALIAAIPERKAPRWPVPAERSPLLPRPRRGDGSRSRGFASPRHGPWLTSP